MMIKVTFKGNNNFLKVRTHKIKLKSRLNKKVSNIFNYFCTKEKEND